MSAAAHAIRLPRLRRLRPPSAWRVYMTLQLIVALGFIALSVVKIMVGDSFWVLTGVLWSVSYVGDRREYQRVKRFEQSHSDVTLPPVPRRRWARLVFLIVLQVYAWTTVP